MGRKETAEQTAARFWSRVLRTDGCWLWQGTILSKGYGQFCIGGARIGTHRFAYETAYGPLQPGQMVCHSCDANYPPGDTTYRACCRPDHLFASDHDGNMADMVGKGRSSHGDRHPSRRRPDLRPRGEQAGTAKLTAAQVTEMRATYARGGITQRALAAQHGVSQATIAQLLRRKRWASVP